jgi:hypothetical protein
MLEDVLCSLPSDTLELIGVSGGDEGDDEEKGHHPIETVESNREDVTRGWHQNESNHSQVGRLV